jgi:E2F-associated phosphoprotein
MSELPPRSTRTPPDGAPPIPSASEQTSAERRLPSPGATAEAPTSEGAATTTSSGEGDEKYMPAPPSQHDEMLFDPDADEEDESAVQAMREGRDSDAHLSCPACFSTLCVDCQRHAKNESLYRAMFVLDVTVNEAATSETAAHHRALLCGSCYTKVGWYDAEEELYYFDGAIASEA